MCWKVLEVGRGIQMNLTILSKNYRFCAIIIRDEVFLRKLPVSANAVVGGFVQWSSSYKGNAAFQKEAEGRFSGIGNMS